MSYIILLKNTLKSQDAKPNDLVSLLKPVQYSQNTFKPNLKIVNSNLGTGVRFTRIGTVPKDDKNRSMWTRVQLASMFLNNGWITKKINVPQIQVIMKL